MSAVDDEVHDITLVHARDRYSYRLFFITINGVVKVKEQHVLLFKQGLELDKAINFKQAGVTASDDKVFFGILRTGTRKTSIFYGDRNHFSRTFFLASSHGFLLRICGSPGRDCQIGLIGMCHVKMIRMPA